MLRPAPGCSRCAVVKACARRSSADLLRLAQAGIATVERCFQNPARRYLAKLPAAVTGELLCADLVRVEKGDTGDVHVPLAAAHGHAFFFTLAQLEAAVLLDRNPVGKALSGSSACAVWKVLRGGERVSVKDVLGADKTNSALQPADYANLACVCSPAAAGVAAVALEDAEARAKRQKVPDSVKTALMALQLGRCCTKSGDGCGEVLPVVEVVRADGAAGVRTP